MSVVRLVVIGYHCNHLGEQLNYQASTHWLIGRSTNYLLCNWYLVAWHTIYMGRYGLECISVAHLKITMNNFLIRNKQNHIRNLM